MLIPGIVWATQSLNAQSSNRSQRQLREMAKRTQVTVVLSAAHTSELTPVSIIRRENQMPRDVIVLHPFHADPEDLSAALMTLLVARQVQGDSPSSNRLLRVNRSTGSSSAPWRAAVLGKANDVFLKLADVPERIVPGFGSVPAYDLFLKRNVFANRLGSRP